MRSKLSVRAKEDLRRIVRRLALVNPRAAEQLYDKLQERAKLAGRSPALGRRVPEVERDDIREAIVGPYRLVYLIEPKRVTILSIFEGHQLLPELELPPE